MFTSFRDDVDGEASGSFVFLFPWRNSQSSGFRQRCSQAEPQEQHATQEAAEGWECNRVTCIQGVRFNTPLSNDFDRSEC